MRSCRLHYFSKRRRPRTYHLNRRTMHRPITKPIRDPVPTFWRPFTWIYYWWRRRIPVPEDRLRQTFGTKTPRRKRQTKTYQPKHPRGHSSRTEKPRTKLNNQKWNHEFGEAEQRRKDAFEQNKHKFLHQSWVMYDMQFGISIDDFLSMTDLNYIKQVRLTRMLQEFDFGTRKTTLDVRVQPEQQTSTIFRRVYIALAQNQVNLPSLRNRYGTEVFEGQQTHSALPALDPNNTPVVLDTGASFSLSPYKSDFVGPLRRSDVPSLKGLSATTTVEGIGTVEWTIRDVFGLVRTIRVSAYYVPQATIRLFSPQVYFQETRIMAIVVSWREKCSSQHRMEPLLSSHIIRVTTYH